MSAFKGVFGTPLGVDFTAALVAGLDARMANRPPQDMARVEIWVNSGRMERNLRAHYLRRDAGFLPRIRPIEAVAHLPDPSGLPKAISDLRLTLELARFTAALLDSRPDLAPRAAIWPLAQSLARLLGEMQEERVSPEVLRDLDMSGHSGHWQVSLNFLDILTRYFTSADAPLTQAARLSARIDRLALQWAEGPPDHPVIIAGSTGSRGATARLMMAVANLPQGAVILPGVDRDMPEALCTELIDGAARLGGLAGQDHPQFRNIAFLRRMGLAPSAIADWAAIPPADAGRNKLISLALRPAPQTDQWLREGPTLPDPRGSMSGVSLLEAETTRLEAQAIALGLRAAVAANKRAALICPDRDLTRQVTAALDRWGIVPDDSAGVALADTAVGHLLRHVAETLIHGVTGAQMLIVLKHPICHSGGEGRGMHLLRTRDLELYLRRTGQSLPDRALLSAWAAGRDEDAGAGAWADWVARCLLDPEPVTSDLPFEAILRQHLARAAHLADGPNAASDLSDSALWRGEAGQEAQKLIAQLHAEADAGGVIRARDYTDLLAGILQGQSLRNPVRPQADILIWGAMEARVQGADLVILAGLNEGIWPAAPEADPWLNRALRAAAGLRLPDREIGLSAHDFQQAAAAPEVWLTRSLRVGEAASVPSRWLNRIVNLMQGASEESRAALDEMKGRGRGWIDLARGLDRPDHPARPAPRPAPCPPVAARPAILSVTQVETLIRDPYAVYARHVLGLYKLPDLTPDPDTADRGNALHKVLEEFTKDYPDTLPEDAVAALLATTQRVLARDVPWPVARRLWAARMARVADWFIEGEVARRRSGQPLAMESAAKWHMQGLGVTIKGKADRLDRLSDGSIAIYDYKAGNTPSDKTQDHFKKQLPIEALMASHGAFTGQKETIAHVAYIALGSQEAKAVAITDEGLAQIEAGLSKLITHFQRADTGFVSRRAMFDLSYDGDYDLLARYGEWEETDPATPEVIA